MERASRIVLVTGAATGIGLATAHAFARLGDLVVLADRDGERAGHAASELGAPHHGCAMDVGDEAAVRSGVAAILARHGRIDVLVNNAGIVDPRAAPALNVAMTTLDDILAVNLTGSYLVAREAGRAMVARGQGAIVNLSSGIAHRSIPGRAAYAMSKAALLGFTRALACEWAGSGVTVNAVLPGYVGTEIVAGLIAEGKVDPASAAARVPLGRLAEPDEIARAIVWTAGNAFVTGASIDVDGGHGAFGGTDPAARAPAPRPVEPAAPVVVITGGARGIGAATADRFAAMDGRVMVLDRDPGDRDGIAVDVTDREAVERAIASVVATHGRIDVLVNNAAIADDFKPTIEQDSAPFDRGLAINLVAPFHIARTVARVMERQGGGAIVNISSIAARGGLPRRSGYCAAKAGIEAMTRSLAIEWAAAGIRVNAVAPGYIATPGVTELETSGKRSLDAVRRRIPVGRLGRPEEIADAIAFLASADASYITGAIVAVDGGWSAFGDAGNASEAR